MFRKILAFINHKAQGAIKETSTHQKLLKRFALRRHEKLYTQSIIDQMESYCKRTSIPELHKSI